MIVRPELVIEIALDGVQASTRYPGGVALRFARVKRYRPDRTPEDADTIDDLEEPCFAGRLRVRGRNDARRNGWPGLPTRRRDSPHRCMCFWNFRPRGHGGRCAFLASLQTLTDGAAPDADGLYVEIRDSTLTGRS